jgi:hypothetical protein
VDIDDELGSLREWDAAVLAGLQLTPDQPRAAGHVLRHALLLRLSGIRGAMKRLEHRGYLEPGWSVDSMGAHCQVTDLGKRVAGAAGAALLARGYADNAGRSVRYVRIRARFGRRLRS